MSVIKKHYSVKQNLARLVSLLTIACCVVTMCSFKAAYDDYQSSKPVQTSNQIIDQQETMSKTSAADAISKTNENNLMAVTEKKEYQAKVEQVEKDRAEEAKRQKALLAKKKKEAAEKAKASEEAEANTEKTTDSNYTWSGAKLSKASGTVMGPSGKETYYNLDMSGVVQTMRRLGYSEAKYPYAVRADGVKTLGGYVMVAANLNLRPRGTLIKTSLGIGIVCDTGGFASSNPRQLDIATTW
ncbi:MAG: hypothetical protein ACOYJJ_01780 [Anaerovoracaceae bacterium]